MDELGRIITAEGNPRNVLIIEDDKFLAEILARKLIARGIEVINVSDTDNARRALKDKERSFDVICLDIVLLGTGGLMFLSEIRTDELFKSIPVLVLANEGQREEVQNVITDGTGTCLFKAEVSPDEIVDGIESLLRPLTQ